eukprot:scaffold165132_cov60-Cyclotella_meneghiniana.AAC.3
MEPIPCVPPQLPNQLILGQCLTLELTPSTRSCYCGIPCFRCVGHDEDDNDDTDEDIHDVECEVGADAVRHRLEEKGTAAPASKSSTRE